MKSLAIMTTLVGPPRTRLLAMRSTETAEAYLDAERSEDRAGIRTSQVTEMSEVRKVSALLADVWGRNAEGVPFPSEVLRSLIHAGGAVTVARQQDRLVGGAVLVREGADSCYSLIAAARPGASDRGIGLALKLRQRAWALEQGYTTMRWTFDPLVARNARFNLTKLGATASEYLPAFYGQMDDQINGIDDADRLVAEWRLDRPVPGPDPDPVAGPPDRENALLGPDGARAFVRNGQEAWCRVPSDVVALRSDDSAQASAWRTYVRDWLGGAMADGFRAASCSRDGWYRLVDDRIQEEAQ